MPYTSFNTASRTKSMRRKLFGCCNESSNDDKSRWSLRHEGAPQRGKGIADLPATVRSVRISAASGRQVLPFWRSLGFRPAFELLKEGQRFLILHAGVEMQASLQRAWHCPIAPPGPRTHQAFSTTPHGGHSFVLCMASSKLDRLHGPEIYFSLQHILLVDG